MKNLLRQLLTPRPDGAGDLSLSPKEALALELLVHADREMFGLQMVEASEGALKRGTVYVILGRLEQKGLVASRQEERHPGAIGLPRRVYHATPGGVRLLAALERAALAFNAEEPAR